MFKRVQKCVILVFSFVLIFQSLTLEAQSDKSLFEKVNRSMSFQDKVWAVQNIKSVKKALSISDRVMNTMEKVLDTLEKENNEIILSEDLILQAEKPINRMLDISKQLGIIK